MPTITEIQNEIIQDFNMFNNWMNKYEFLIDLGKELEPLNQKYKTDDNLIKGCQSRVWLHAEENDGLVHFFADSDAIMTKGIVALLIRVFSRQNASDIAAADLIFIDKIGLKEHLSATRANGLVSMIKQMKLYALALSR
tara:strand:- start:101 stop:517 length:417 start_codon:yes stop_codon:yes gene_type:complete